MESNRQEENVDIHMDQGMTIKRTLYNALYDHGVFLPRFSSNCVTLQSLERIRHSDEFYVYYCKELELELVQQDILVSPTELVYEFIQRYHIEKFKRPLPFERAPPADFLKPILKHIDPENRMLFLKRSWKHNYRSDVVRVGDHVFCYEPTQGQTLQRRVDQELNNATRMRNMMMGLHWKKKEVEAELVALRSTVTSEQLNTLGEMDRLAFTKSNVEDIYQKMVDTICQGKNTSRNIEITKEVNNAIRGDVNMSDVGEDPEVDVNLEHHGQIFGYKPRSDEKAPSPKKITRRPYVFEEDTSKSPIPHTIPTSQTSMGGASILKEFKSKDKNPFHDSPITISEESDQEKKKKRKRPRVVKTSRNN